MLDNIKLQLKKKDVLTRMNAYLHQRSAAASTNHGDFYPFLNEYYHELNPAFVTNLNYIETLELFPVVTVRDASVPLANWLLKNFQQIPLMKTHFFIHPSHVKLLPANLYPFFSCWNIVQTKKIQLQQANRIVLSGVLNETVIDLKNIEKMLRLLGDIPQHKDIELFIPQRRNPFSLPWNDSNIIQELIDLIKTFYPQNKLTFLKVQDILETTVWNGTFVVDLLKDSVYMTDSYVNHFMAARGATISSYSSQEASNTVYELDLSLNHKIQYFPMQESHSIFADLIFHKKQSPIKDLLQDLRFHALLKKKNV